MAAPFAIKHFHGSQRIYAGISESNHMEVNVARDKIITKLDEFSLRYLDDAVGAWQVIL